MTTLKKLVFVAASVFVMQVQAGPDPQSIDLGGGKLIPLLSVATKHDDNIFSQRTGEQSDTITTLKPSIQWLQEKDTTSLAVTYTGDYGIYWDSSDDNYNDHTMSFDAATSAGEWVNVLFGASYGWQHDNRGEGSSEGINALSRGEPDEYEISSINLDLDFGRDAAMFGAKLMASQDDIQYQNNRNETVFRDRNDTYVAGRAYAKISGGKTRVFLQASQKDITYDEDPLLGGKLDSTEDGYSVGVEWEATGKTTGSVRIGKVDKDFDSAGRTDSDLNVWEAGVTWSPRTYSHFILNASKQPRETNGTGSFIESRDTSLTWMHAWSDILSSSVSLSNGTDDYTGNARSDDRQSFSIGLNYDFRRWITLGASYSYQERDSNTNQFDYEKNVFSITASMSL